MTAGNTSASEGKRKKRLDIDGSRPEKKLSPHYQQLISLKFPIFNFPTLRTFYAQHLPHSLFSVLSTLRIFYTPHFPHSAFFYTLCFLHSALSTFPIFHTPQFLHPSFSTLHTFHTPLFLHSAFAILRF